MDTVLLEILVYGLRGKTTRNRTIGKFFQTNPLNSGFLLRETYEFDGPLL